MKHTLEPSTAAPLRAGIYESGTPTHPGLVSLIGVDHDGNVQLTAQVSEGYYKWLTDNGHISTADDTIERYADELAHATRRGRLTLVRSSPFVPPLTAS